MEEMKYYSKFVIDEVQGRVTARVQDIKQGCLVNSDDIKTNKTYREAGVFLTEEEALQALKKYVSSYQSYSSTLHCVTEYVLTEVIYEADEQTEEEYPYEYRQIALSKFDHYQLWIVKADKTLRFSHIIKLDDDTPFKIPYREDDIGAIWTNLDGKVVKEFNRDIRKDKKMDKKTEWLKNLKVGDKVIVCVTKYGNFDMNIATVDKVTKKHIYIGNRIFDMDGNQSRYNTGKLMMPTENMLKEVEKTKLKAKTKELLQNVLDNIIILDYEQMSTICNIIENNR